MFEVGDYVVYDSYGVYQVNKVGSLDMSGVPKDKIYYTLVSPYVKDAIIYSAVDNSKVIMRAIMDKEEAMDLIAAMKDVELFDIKEDKKRNEIFNEALKTCDCKELVKIIKTLYIRQEQKLAEGKKSTAGDDKYLKIAEERLYGELAISLNMDRKDVKEFVEKKVAEYVENT